MSNDHDKSLLNQIFSFLPAKESEIPDSWNKWQEGKSNYKPFSLQLNECKKNNVSFDYHAHGCELLMCRKYGGQCISLKCKSERRGNKHAPWNISYNDYISYGSYDMWVNS